MMCRRSRVGSGWLDWERVARRQGGHVNYSTMNRLMLGKGIASRTSAAFLVRFVLNKCRPPNKTLSLNQAP